MKNFIIISIIVILQFVIIEYLQKKVFNKTSWSRKATHISVGLTVMFFPTYLNIVQICILSATFFLFLLFSRKKLLLNLHFSERISWGEIIYPISIAVITLICLPNNVSAFYVGVLCLSLSDSLANIIGTYLPIRKFVIAKHQKSIGGSLTFFTSSALIFYFFLQAFGVNIFVILGFASLLTAVEIFSLFGFDNLAVPLIASLLVIMIL